MTELVVDGIAVWRLWRLAARDTILDGPRSWWEQWAWDRYAKAPEPGRAPEVPKVIVLVGCPFCLGFWLTIAALACKRLTPRLWSVMRAVLATSALVGLIAELEDRIER